MCVSVFFFFPPEFMSSSATSTMFMHIIPFKYECMLIPVASHCQCPFNILLQCLIFIMTSFPFKGCDELVCNVLSL